MIEVLKTLKLNVYRSYYFQSWDVDDFNFVTHVNFLSHFKQVILECSALFYYGKRGVSAEALEGEYYGD
jgi:hypothetical protein